MRPVDLLPTLRVVDRAQAIAELPRPYAIAIGLRDAGVADDVIAGSLGIEADGLGSFFSLAMAKLDRVMRGPTAVGNPPETELP